MKSCLKPLTIGLVFCFLADASMLRAQTDAREQTVSARPGSLNADGSFQCTRSPANPANCASATRC